jgi:pilus assembly protein Flp/PilA
MKLLTNQSLTLLDCRREPAMGNDMTRLFKRLLGDRRGATAVEYGLIIALVVLAIIGGLNNFANSTIGMWNNVSNEVEKH